MTLINETIGFAIVGLLAGSVVVGTVVAVNKSDQEKVSVESNQKPPPSVPSAIPRPKPVTAPPPPPPAHIESISKEIMKEDPSLSKEEVVEAVEKADRLDHIEQRIDEVVVEQRKLSDRIEAIISKQGPEK